MSKQSKSKTPVQSKYEKQKRNYERAKQNCLKSHRVEHLHSEIFDEDSESEEDNKVNSGKRKVQRGSKANGVPVSSKNYRIVSRIATTGMWRNALRNCERQTIIMEMGSSNLEINIIPLVRVFTQILVDTFGGIDLQQYYTTF